MINKVIIYVYSGRIVFVYHSIEDALWAKLAMVWQTLNPNRGSILQDEKD